MTNDQTECEAYRPIVETERATDQWLAEALRKISRDGDTVRQTQQRISVKGQMTTVSSVLNALADVLERNAGGTKP